MKYISLIIFIVINRKKFSFSSDLSESVLLDAEPLSDYTSGEFDGLRSDTLASLYVLETFMISMTIYF